MTENLGPAVAWQVRDVPEAVRDAVTEQARVEGVKVAELLTRLVLDARAAGWSMDASNRFANTSNGVDPGRRRAAVEAVCQLQQAGVPLQKRVVALANRVAMEGLLDVSKLPPRTLALPSPAEDAAA